MKAEKQHKESPSLIIQSKQGHGRLGFINNRVESIVQAKLIANIRGIESSHVIQKVRTEEEEATINLLKTSSIEWKDGLTRTPFKSSSTMMGEFESIRSYTGGGSLVVNDYIENNLTPSRKYKPGSQKKMYDAMLSAFLKSPQTTGAITVYSGGDCKVLFRSNQDLKEAALIILGSYDKKTKDEKLAFMINKPFVEKGYMSTSINESVAKNRFATNTLLVISVPQNSHAAYLGDMFEQGAGKRTEEEVLFPPGQNMRIDNVVLGKLRKKDFIKVFVTLQ